MYLLQFVTILASVFKVYPIVSDVDNPEKCVKSSGCVSPEECITQDPHKCSSPINNSSHSLERYESTPNHFPSFNIPMEDSSDEEGTSGIHSTDKKEREESKMISKTRSGKVYKTI